MLLKKPVKITVRRVRKISNFENDLISGLLHASTSGPRTVLSWAKCSSTFQRSASEQISIAPAATKLQSFRPSPDRNSLHPAPEPKMPKTPLPESRIGSAVGPLLGPLQKLVRQQISKNRVEIFQALQPPDFFNGRLGPASKKQRTKGFKIGLLNRHNLTQTTAAPSLQLLLLSFP